MMRFMIVYIEAALGGVEDGFIARVLEKGWRYWLVAAAVLVGTVYFQHDAYEALHLADKRAAFFSLLFRLDWRPLEAGHGKVVLIDDDEYWKGELAGRRPIKRGYLGDLVERLAAAHAAVVAIDFDMRLPDPDATAIGSDYADETNCFINKILAAAAGTKIVLGKTVGLDQRRRYMSDPDVYQVYGLCKPAKAGGWENSADFPVTARDNIRCGFIELPFDPLVIPETLPLNGHDVDSFALAIARAKDAKAVEGKSRSEERYGSGIPSDVLEDQEVLQWAQDVKRNSVDENRKIFDGQSVIIGAAWSSLGYKRGNTIDAHLTATGLDVGAVVHDNFVEALLASRAFYAVPHWVLILFELAFGTAAALVFAGFPNFLPQLWWLLGFSALLLVIQWTILHGLGLFFDGFFPLFGLWLHAASERMIGYHPAHAR